MASTNAPSTTGDKETHDRPPAKSPRAPAISAASRDLPTPPGPTTDTRPGAATAAASSATSSSRATKVEPKTGTRAARFEGWSRSAAR